MGLEWDNLGLYNQQYTNNPSVSISQPEKKHQDPPAIHQSTEKRKIHQDPSSKPLMNGI